MNNDGMFPKDSTEDILFNSLNEQGYLFQEACKYELKRVDTGWSVKSSEYPVSIMEQNTKIDLVLEHQNTFAIVECKRADPIYKKWLFSELEVNKRSSPMCQVLSLQTPSLISSASPLDIKFSVEQKDFDVPTYIARTSIEVNCGSLSPRSGQNNQNILGLSRRSSSPQNIENAFCQVLTGLSGFAKEQKDQSLRSHEGVKLFFIPIVVTTASLYLAHYKAQDIDLSTGKINRNKVVFGQNAHDLEQQNWVLVEYGVSNYTTPPSIPDNVVSTDPHQLLKYKMRSIFVVNSTHLTEFFKKL